MFLTLLQRLDYFFSITCSFEVEEQKNIFHSALIAKISAPLDGMFDGTMQKAQREDATLKKIDRAGFS